MKKKLLPIALLCALGLVGCAETPAPTETETNSNTSSSQVEVNVTTVTIANAEALKEEWHTGEKDRLLEITTDVPVNVNKEINAGNLKITSDKPEVITVTGRVLTAKQDGFATITVQWKDTDVKASVRLEILPVVKDEGPVVAEKFEVGGTYKLGLYQKSEKETIFFTSTLENHRYNGTKEYKDGASVTVLAGSKENTYALKAGDKYLDVTRVPKGENKPGEFYNNLDLVDNPADWVYDETLDTLLRVFEGATPEETVKFYIGAFGTKMSFGASGIEHAKDEDACIAHFYDFLVKPHVAKEIKAGKYLFGAADGAAFLNGKESKYNVAASNYAEDAIEFDVAATADGKWTIKNGEKYLGVKITDDQKHANLKYIDTEYAWKWDAKFSNFATKVSTLNDKNVLEEEDVKIIHSFWSGDFSLKPVKDKNTAGVLMDKIVPADAIGVSAKAKAAEIEVGAKTDVIPTVYPSGASQKASFASLTPEIATVDANTGKVTGVTAGTAQIEVTAATFKTIVEIEIKGAALPTDYPTDDAHTLMAAYDMRVAKSDVTNGNKLDATTGLGLLNKGYNGPKDGNKLTATPTVTNLYDGTGSGGALPNTAGLIKFGKSKNAGTLAMTFADGVAITKVAILGLSYNAAGKDASKIGVNDSEMQTMAQNETNAPTWLTFDLTAGTNSITIKTAERAYVWAIAVYVAK